MNRSEDSVGVFATADGTVSWVNIGDNESGGGRPVGLEEAKDVVGLSFPGRDSNIWVTESGGKAYSFAEGTMLDSGSKE